MLTGLCEDKLLKECLEICKERSVKKILIFFVCFIIITPLAIFFAMRIIEIYKLYKLQSAPKENQKTQTRDDSILGSENDDYVDESKIEAANVALADEHEVISNAIQKSFDGYKEYNNILTKFYEERDKVAPNIMDESILSSNNDNW